MVSGQCTRTFAHAEPVHAVCASPDGTAFYSGGADGVVRVFELDWEPDDAALPEWDARARPFLEVFLARRKAATTGPLAPAEMGALLAELRPSGFGWLTREQLARRLEPLLAQRTAFWDEILRSAPRNVAPPPRSLEVRKRFRWEYVGLGVAVVLFLIGVASWLPRGLLSATYNAALAQSRAGGGARGQAREVPGHLLRASAGRLGRGRGRRREPITNSAGEIGDGSRLPRAAFACRAPPARSSKASPPRNRTPSGRKH